MTHILEMAMGDLIFISSLPSLMVFMKPEYVCHTEDFNSKLNCLNVVQMIYIWEALPKVFYLLCCRWWLKMRTLSWSGVVESENVKMEKKKVASTSGLREGHQKSFWESSDCPKMLMCQPLQPNAKMGFWLWLLRSFLHHPSPKLLKLPFPKIDLGRMGKTKWEWWVSRLLICVTTML